MAEKEITVACEACGEIEVIITKENSKVFTALDLFICPQCIYSWSMISGNLKMRQMEATTANEHEKLDKNIKKLFKIAEKAMLKTKPLPRIRETVKPKDRLDSIILLEDDDG